MKKSIDENKSYPLLPLRDVVVFPHMVVPLFVGREKSIKALDAAMRNNRLILLSTQKNPQISVPGKDDLYEVGTLCEVLQMLKLPEGTIKVLVEGVGRAFISSLDDEKNDYMEANIKIIEREVEDPENILELKNELISTFEEYVKNNKKVSREALTTVSSIEDPSHLSDAVASHINMRVDLKQSIIEIGDPIERIKTLIGLIGGELEVIEVEKKIHGTVRKKMEKTQKDYYLNEQMKVIKKELGDGEEIEDEIEELKRVICDAKMPKEVEEKALKELKRLSKIPPMSAESAVVRNYIEWLKDIPWSKKTRDIKDIDKAKDILDKDHYGLEKVKERILEFIAVKSLSKKIKGPIICFVGPPGVGKTSLGKSVAHALGRKFIRFSLGGVRDEAEIRGHRRTYVGALPGRIVQAIKKSGTVNPVILLDEIDKMATDFRGDPSSALLEVLDPEQNSNFTDHYLEVPYDLSDVMFITTANVQHEIPLPLQDRMEVIEISSYTEPEKLNIARKYLIPKQIKENGISDENMEVSEDMVLFIIRHYTKEAGVRNLERTFGKLARKVACEVIRNSKEHKVELTEEKIKEYLGPIKFQFGRKDDANEIGLANGLAWTAVGGDMMKIEASLIKGKGKLMLTGKLGEVMQESGQAAFTYVKAKQPFFSIDEELFDNRDVHLHVPEGAIPKDGPSAGITMAVVLSSLLSGIAVRQDVAMTGEITLRGKVLPIGGLKEKVLAAHRAGIEHIIFPKENAKDLDKLPEYIKKELLFHPVEKMEEVLFLALESPEKFFKNQDDTKKLSDRWEEEARAVISHQGDKQVQM